MLQKKNNKIAATAENIRRNIITRTAYWAINQLKLLGKPTVFFSQHASWEVPEEVLPWTWRAEKLLSGGGLAFDSGAHFCDTIRYLFGDVESVYAKVGILKERLVKKGENIVKDEREDMWLVILTFKSGLIGFWSCMFTAPGPEFTRVVYYGTEGSLVDAGDIFHGPFEAATIYRNDGKHYHFSDLKEQFISGLSNEERERLFPCGFIYGEHFRQGFILEIYDFLDAIQKNRQVEIPAEEGLKSKAIAEAIYESSFIGEPVKVQDVIDAKVEAYQKEINERLGIE